MPKGASSNAASLASYAWGAWSEAMQSITPCFSAARSAATRGERRLFAMIRDGHSEGAGILECRAHQVTRHDGLAVVRHGDGAGGHHLAELRQVLAALSHRNRPDRKHPREPGPRRLTYDEPHRRLVVADGIG